MKRLLILILAVLLTLPGCGFQPPDLSDPVVETVIPTPLPEPVTPLPQPEPEPLLPVSVQVPVLLYHAFSPDREGAVSYTWVSVPMLEQQLAALKEAGYRSVTLAQLADFAETGAPLPEKPVVITADDGYLNNLTLAAPVFEKYGFTLSVAVIGVSEGKESYKDTGTPIIPHFSLDQARPWVEKGVVELFSHTYDMHQSALDGADYRLSVLPREGESDVDYRSALALDFAKSAAQLGDMCAPALAYPHGRWTEEAEKAAKEAGFAVTMTTQPGTNTVTSGDPGSLRLLNRNYVEDSTTGADLIALLEGLETK